MRTRSVGKLWLGFALAAFAVGCSASGGGTVGTPLSALSPNIVASVVYPTSAPSLAPGQSVATLGATVPVSFVFTTQNLNATYQLMIVPTPVATPVPAGIATGSPQPVTLALNPGSLPTALPTLPASAVYAISSVVQLQPVTTYTLSLVGCPSGAPCANPQTISLGTFQSGCVPVSLQQAPPPGLPIMALPSGGATNVPATVGTLLFAALNSYAASNFTLTSSAGTRIPVTATAVPSPLPSGVTQNNVYFALALPALLPATTYSVAYSGTIQTSTPPCSAPTAWALGNFTTQ